MGHSLPTLRIKCQADKEKRLFEEEGISLCAKWCGGLKQEEDWGVSVKCSINSSVVIWVRVYIVWSFGDVAVSGGVNGDEEEEAACRWEIYEDIYKREVEL